MIKSSHAVYCPMYWLAIVIWNWFTTCLLQVKESAKKGCENWWSDRSPFSGSWSITDILEHISISFSSYPPDPLELSKKKRFKIISHYLASQHCTATFVALVVTVVANIVNPARRCKLRQGSRLKNLIVMYTYWNFGLKVEYAEMFEKESSRSR